MSPPYPYPPHYLHPPLLIELLLPLPTPFSLNSSTFLDALVPFELIFLGAIRISSEAGVRIGKNRSILAGEEQY
jgi:hypothetical protein